MAIKDFKNPQGTKTKIKTEDDIFVTIEAFGLTFTLEKEGGAVFAEDEHDVKFESWDPTGEHDLSVEQVAFATFLVEGGLEW